MIVVSLRDGLRKDYASKLFNLLTSYSFSNNKNVGFQPDIKIQHKRLLYTFTFNENI